MLEVLVGPCNSGREWLQPTKPENSFLLSFLFPYHCNVIARRKFFEFSTNDNVFLKVNTHGFFHVILPLDSHNRSDIYTLDKTQYNFDLIAKEIFSILDYCMRIFVFHQIEDEQSIRIIFRDMGGKNIVYLDKLSIASFWFANQPETEFSFEMYPKNGWKGLGKLFCTIFKELCIEMGYVDIDDSAIKERVKMILQSDAQLHSSYQSGTTIVPSVATDEFGLGKR
jgi:hypothetical protein